MPDEIANRPADQTRGIASGVAFQTALLAVPYIGASLERAIYGAGAERRWRRFESTLAEIAERLSSLDSTHRVESEQFVHLLESVAQPIATATSETRRHRFRDLLVNAGRRDLSTSEWEEAQLAAELLEPIADPGLEILSVIRQFRRDGEEAVIVLEPPVRFHAVRREAFYPEKGELFTHSSALIDEWMHRLVRMRLISYTTPLHMREEGQPKIMFRGGGELALTELAELLVTWAVDDPEPTNE